MKKKSTAKKVLLTILGVLLALVIVLVGTVYAVWHDEITTLLSFQQVTQRDESHKDGSVYVLNVSGGYHFDEFLAQGGGKIVMISSTAAKNVNLGASPSYGASKAGMVYLTRHLAAEFGSHSIYANSICPGPVDTEITRTWTPEHRQKVLQSLPLGRMGTPEDIANCALFLASSMSDYINGESILVNGGRYMD